MKYFISLAALSAALIASPAYANEAQTLSIKDFIGTVTITTGDSFSVSGERGDATEIRQNGLTIDGNETIDNSSCKSVNGNIDISIGKKSWFKRIGGYKDLDEYPNLEITVPEGSHLNIRNSVLFGTGQIFSGVDADIESCGTFEVGDINGPLKLNVSGSGDFSAGNVETADINVSGSGDVTLGDMSTATIKVRGSGDVEGANISGGANISTTGSGDVELGEITGGLVYEGRGSSVLDASRVDGSISISVTGSGDVDIDDGQADVFMVTSRGSSNVDFGGTAGDVTIISSGSGNVKVSDATGAREVKTSGSAAVRIGDKRYDD